MAEEYVFRQADEPGPSIWGVALSSTIWSAALVSPLVGRACPSLSNDSEIPLMMFFNWPVWFCAIATAFVQGYFAAYVQAIVAEAEELCVEPSPLTFLCVSVLTASAVAGDIMDSIRTYLWLREFPEGSMQSLKLVQEKYKDYEGGPTVLWRPTDGIPLWYRSLCFLFLIVLRACLAAAIACIGAGHIVLSETDEDRILNTVGLLFVLDLDEIAHNLFTPPYIQRRLERMPSIESVLAPEPPAGDPNVPVAGNFLWFANLCRFWIMFTFWILASTILTYSWCESNQAAILGGVGATLAVLTCCFCSCMGVSDGKTVLAGRPSHSMRTVAAAPAPAMAPEVLS